MKKQIRPETDLRSLLMGVQTPGRYVGGEFGTIFNEGSADLQFGICFPDMYEIGMSNLAIRLLYSHLNSIEGVDCERVFAPAQDFEEALKVNSVPLYTLESGTPLHELDVLGFSVGYELTATNILTVLESGGIPIQRNARGSESPVVIAGGPAITNPAPFADFLDGVWIGEAEEGFLELIVQIRDIKKQGGGRDAILNLIEDHPAVWTPTKKKTSRAIWNEFSNSLTNPQGFIVPSIKTVQDHGIIEIMRGCPTGCRFCHAGYFYRPFRQKSIEMIEQEVENLIRYCGYREITLASLSSGDYNSIENLMLTLNRKYSAENISFAFPSMRVDSFTLSLLDQLSDTRKSGLTFAVETPNPDDQIGLNKSVPVERTIAILKEAKKLGWKKAKFYFMIGLPFSRPEEGTEIADFVNQVQFETKMNLNVTVGTFIPKPHTPFQWGRQITEEESLTRIHEIKNKINRGIKLGYHSPFASYLEGLVTRGDKDLGGLIKNAWDKGARFDAWDDIIDRHLWRDEINEFKKTGWDDSIILNEKKLDTKLPWDNINLGISQKFFKDEWEKAKNSEMTPLCDTVCDHNCGVCGTTDQVVKANEGVDDLVYQKPIPNIQEDRRDYPRVLFAFDKVEKGIYLSHINVMQVFERAFIRAGIDIRYTEGFNPKPRLEFAHPLSLGITSEYEIVSVDLNISIDTDSFIEKINAVLPEGLIVNKAMLMKPLDPKRKRPSLMALYAGGSYEIKHLNGETIPDIDEELMIQWPQLIITKLENNRILVEDEMYKKVNKNANVRKFFEEAFGDDFLKYFEQKRVGMIGLSKGSKVGIDYFSLLCDQE